MMTDIYVFYSEGQVCSYRVKTQFLVSVEGPQVGGQGIEGY